MKVKDGIILRHTNSNKNPQVLVPTSLRHKILFMAHDHPSSGHLGIRRTLRRVTDNFYWYNVKEDVRKWCATCLQCAKFKIRRQHHKEGMKSIKLEGKPRYQFAADIVGPLNITEDGYRYILVVTDLFTNFF